ncbi:MAG: K(+)-transporting ATPase subunit F [Acetobacteraceae bacterium]|nr:K(+)-transporting ATPase subunit F [Acetobacteraceae bacterium]
MPTPGAPPRNTFSRPRPSRRASARSASGSGRSGSSCIGADHRSGAAARHWSLRRLYAAAAEHAWRLCARRAHTVATFHDGRTHHARPSPACPRPWRLRFDGALRRRLRADLTPMLELILGGAVAAALLGYLLWALLRPESL